MVRKAWLFATGIFLLGGICGFILRPVLLSRTGDSMSERHEGQLQFINPLLECNTSEQLAGRELSSFHTKIEQWVAEEVSQRHARSISVYFRDLNNGPWFGIDEDEKFIPASLMKVPLMMAYFKHAENDPGILKREITFDIEPSLMEQVINSGEKLQRGKRYTVEQLIEKMIMDSDNDAALLLLYNDKDQYYRKLFDETGISPPSYDKEDHFLTVKEYSSLFRVLFNASYLNRDMSNRALALLAQAKFRGGLVAGVHPSIVVAHKFGERDLESEQQFHDCGIVYFPGRPYLLCIMSRGAGIAGLANAVQTISYRVFEEVSRQTVNR